MLLRALFELYGLEPGALTDDIEDAVLAKRAWARAMLNNAKWREKALLIHRRWRVHRRRMLAFGNIEGVPSQTLEQLDLLLRGLTMSGLSKPDQLRAAGGQAQTLGLSPEIGQQRFRMLHPGIELLDSFDRIRVDDDDTERMDEELLRKKG